MAFDLGDYVDVAERIKIFREKHPAGSLQSEITIAPDGSWALCKAYAYRGPEDAIPGIGHSRLTIPGSTPYTRDSEIENAETSAWGRAIVAALAADTKKVASADEVRSKELAGGPTGQAQSVTPNTPEPAPAQTNFTAPAKAPQQGAMASAWTWPFGKHKGKTLAETDQGYLDWFLEKSDKEDIKQLVREYLNIAELEAMGATTDDDIPFAPSIDGIN